MPSDSDSGVTLRDVAKAAGVGMATASRALRNQPVAEKTRKKVKAVAKRLGYLPDPRISSFIEYRWRGKRRASGLNLALLYSKQFFGGPYDKDLLFADPKAMAAKFGYQLIPINVDQFKDVRILLRRMRAQGISGCILAMFPYTPYKLDAVTEALPCIAHGVSSYRPKCPVFMHDEFGTVRSLWKRLVDLGVKKVGTVILRLPASQSYEERLGPHLVQEVMNVDSIEIVPKLWLQKGKEETFESELMQWYERYQPEVIIGVLAEYCHLLRKCGVRIPEDVSYIAAAVYQDEDVGQVSGYYINQSAILERGFDMLDMMVKARLPGAKFYNITQHMQVDYVEGKTLQVRKR